MHQSGKTTWVSKVKELSGILFAFTTQGCGQGIIQKVVSRYKDQFTPWHSELSRQTSKGGEAGNKLLTYRLFKSQFQLEGYLSQMKVAKYCIALTKLRASCHRLQIELRYHKPCSIPPDQRLCKLCSCIEDEVYFLCVCPAYNNLLEDLYAVIYKFHPSFTVYLSIRDKFANIQ